MRRLAAALVLLAVSGTSARGQAPYSVRWGDAASVVAAGVVALIPEATKLPKSGPSCGSTAPCDPASLPGIDRSALHTFSGSASTTSTVLLAGVIGFAGLTSFDGATAAQRRGHVARSEEHTSELQSLAYLVCRLLLEKKKSLAAWQHGTEPHRGWRRARHARRLSAH